MNIILGPPGTGKTTTLLNLMETHIASGIHPSKIAFISFTKQATEEAKARAILRFKLDSEDLRYFKTIHALAFRQLGLATSEVIRWQDYKRFGEAMGLEFTGKKAEDGTLMQLSKGDRLVFMEQMSRLRCCDLKKVWEDTRDSGLDWWELDQVSRALVAFKKANAIIDYTDMLTRFLSSETFPQLEVLFIDEAQDLSQLQWRVVQRLMSKSRSTYIAGDDDQAIFRWSGADVEHFINLKGDIQVLDQSYRLPKVIHTLANNIVSSISHRYEKRFNSRNYDGYIYYLNYIEDLNLSSGQWLVLVRNTYMLKNLESFCKNQGVFYTIQGLGGTKSEHLMAIRTYEKLRSKTQDCSESGSNIRVFFNLMKNKPPMKLSKDVNYRFSDLGLPDKPWFEVLDGIPLDDREYVRAMLRRGEKLAEPPRVKLSTIHGAKGGEAENVALFTDISYRTHAGMQENPDDEARVFYVGVTRAKESLYIMQPQTDKYYQL